MQKLLFGSLLFLNACNQPTAQKIAVNGNPNDFSLTGKSAIVYTTLQGQEPMKLSATLRFEKHPQPMETDICVFIDPSHQFQTIMGFGGAITDAAAETFAKLPADKQEEILKAYYDPENGIGYNIIRTNINSCDFSSDSYTYVERNDTALKTFSVQHDEKFKIPLIKKANEKLNGNMILFCSPWSPPAWMKDNNDMLHGGKLKPEFYQTWANYFVKFINT